MGASIAAVRRQGRRAACFLSALLLSMTALAAPREELSLNGSWQVANVPSLDAKPSSGAWKEMEIPGFLDGYNYERAWLRRSFTVPSRWNGKRIFVRFGGIKFDSRVFVNGKHVGGCFNGYDAFELDVTDAVEVGTRNELLVGVQDWTGLFTGDRVDFRGRSDWMEIRNIPRNRVLSPIGGRFDLYGIWDDVSLVAVPLVHIRDFFVRRSASNV